MSLALKFSLANPTVLKTFRKLQSGPLDWEKRYFTIIMPRFYGWSALSFKTSILNMCFWKLVVLLIILLQVKAQRYREREGEGGGQPHVVNITFLFSF